jgi:hypothetical protein
MSDLTTKADTEISLERLLGSEKLASMFMDSEVQELMETKSEKHLREKLKHANIKIIDCIRLSFWHEYDQAVARDTQMSMTRVYASVCTHRAFYRHLEDPWKAAYVFTRPVKQTLLVEALQMRILDRFDDVLELSLENGDGEIDNKLIKNLIDIYKINDLRLHGGPMQHTRSESVNYNVNTDDPSVKKKIDYKNMEVEELEKRLAERRASLLSDAIDVTPDDQD